MTALVDIVCAVFMGILYARNFSERSLSKSNRYLDVCLAVMLITLLIDASAYTFVGPSYSVPFRFFINLMSFLATCVNVILFTFYVEVLFSENGEINPWPFRFIKGVELVWAFATAYEFIAGHLITYGLNGVENLDYAFPTYIVVLNLAIQFYLVALTIINCRRIGKDMTVLLCVFFIAPIFTSVLFSFIGIDFAYAFGAIMLGLVSEFVQKKQTKVLKQEQTLTKELAEQQRNMKSFGDMVNAALWTIILNDRNEIVKVIWSNEIRRMLGYEETEEAFPNSMEMWKGRILPEDKEHALEHFHNCLKNQNTEEYVYDTKYRMRKKNGDIHWYHIVGRMDNKDDGTRMLYGILLDITLEKQVEEQQLQLKAALEAANAEQRKNNTIHEIINSGKWSFFVNSDDEIVGSDVSAAANKVINNDVVADGRSWIDIVHPDDREYARDAFEATIKDHSCNTPYDVNYRMIDRNGGYRWFHSAGRIIRDKDGNGEFFGVHIDITNQMEEQRKRLLGAMPLSNDVLAKANIGLWAFELDEGMAPRMYDDETMLGLVGLDHQVSPEEAYHAWYDNIDEGSYDLVADAVAKMTAGEHAEVQYPWHFPDGRTIMVRCGGIRNFEYTKGIRIEGTHQDVTQTMHFDEEERERAKQLENDLIMAKLRADSLAFLSDNEPNLDTAINFFGNRILEIFGCDQVIFRELDGHRIVLNAPGENDIPQEICSNCPLVDFNSEIYGDDGIVLMNDCREGFRGVMVHPDCPAKSSFMQQIYSGGELAGLFTIHYLNERHSFSESGINIMKTVSIYLGLLIGRIREKQAEKARIEAESANKAKTEFLFSMSHDIRTPMNAILGYTDIAIRHTDEPGRVNESLKKIKVAGGHLLNLINDILEMSRIEAGALEIVSAPLNMLEAIESVDHMSQALAFPKDIDYSTVVRNVSNPYIYADELHVNQVLINLISNAVKYTNPGGKVEYLAEQIGEPVKGIARYRFTIQDNGIGMSNEFQTHLFENFSRERTATVSKQEGTGLGLAIVKKIIDLVGGTIRVRSAQGKGSTFVVEMPFRVMDDAAIEKFKHEHDNDDMMGDVALEGKRILLVEDNEMNREIAIELLSESGLVIEEAEDGEIAVKTIASKGVDYYDFVLMDIQMPVMDGYEATKEIRKLPNGDRIPIIALSANAFKEDVEKSLSAGMNAHVAKPIDLKNLFEEMQKLVTSR